MHSRFGLGRSPLPLEKIGPHDPHLAWGFDADAAPTSAAGQSARGRCCGVVVFCLLDQRNKVGLRLEIALGTLPSGRQPSRRSKWSRDAGVTGAGTLRASIPSTHGTSLRKANRRKS
jgi:hypothetical protein